MTTITGSLLNITEGTILHQVNARGATGGLAGALRRKWPEAFVAYRVACALHKTQIGYVEIGRTTSGLHIAHVFGQRDPGPNTDMAAVENALNHFVRPPIPAYAPYRMGCGLGGGHWPDYLALLEKYVPDIIIVQRPEDV